MDSPAESARAKKRRVKKRKSLAPDAVEGTPTLPENVSNTSKSSTAGPAAAVSNSSAAHASKSTIVDRASASESSTPAIILPAQAKASNKGMQGDALSLQLADPTSATKAPRKKAHVEDDGNASTVSDASGSKRKRRRDAGMKDSRNATPVYASHVPQQSEKAMAGPAQAAQPTLILPSAPSSTRQPMNGNIVADKSLIQPAPAPSKGSRTSKKRKEPTAGDFSATSGTADTSGRPPKKKKKKDDAPVSAASSTALPQAALSESRASAMKAPAAANKDPAPTVEAPLDMAEMTRRAIAAVNLRIAQSIPVAVATQSNGSSAGGSSRRTVHSGTQRTTTDEAAQPARFTAAALDAAASASEPAGAIQNQQSVSIPETAHKPKKTEEEKRAKAERKKAKREKEEMKKQQAALDSEALKTNGLPHSSNDAALVPAALPRPEAVAIPDVPPMSLQPEVAAISADHETMEDSVTAQQSKKTDSENILKKNKKHKKEKKGKKSKDKVSASAISLSQRGDTHTTGTLSTTAQPAATSTEAASRDALHESTSQITEVRMVDSEVHEVPREAAKDAAAQHEKQGKKDKREKKEKKEKKEKTEKKGKKEKKGAENSSQQAVEMGVSGSADTADIAVAIAIAGQNNESLAMPTAPTQAPNNLEIQQAPTRPDATEIAVLPASTASLVDAEPTSSHIPIHKVVMVDRAVQTSPCRVVSIGISTDPEPTPIASISSAATQTDAPTLMPVTPTPAPEQQALPEWHLDVDSVDLPTPALASAPIASASPDPAPVPTASGSPAPTSVPIASASPAPAGAVPSASPRIRLADEESDSDLRQLHMEEFEGDDTNHSEDETMGLYLPRPNDSLLFSGSQSQAAAPQVIPTDDTRDTNGLRQASTSSASSPTNAEGSPDTHALREHSTIMEAAASNLPAPSSPAVQTVSTSRSKEGMKTTTPSRILETLPASFLKYANEQSNFAPLAAAMRSPSSSSATAHRASIAYSPAHGSPSKAGHALRRTSSPPKSGRRPVVEVPLRSQNAHAKSPGQTIRRNLPAAAVAETFIEGTTPANSDTRMAGIKQHDGNVEGVVADHETEASPAPLATAPASIESQLLDMPPSSNPRPQILPSDPPSQQAVGASVGTEGLSDTEEVESASPSRSRVIAFLDQVQDEDSETTQSSDEAEGEEANDSEEEAAAIAKQRLRLLKQKKRLSGSYRQASSSPEAESEESEAEEGEPSVPLVAEDNTAVKDATSAAATLLELEKQNNGSKATAVVAAHEEDPEEAQTNVIPDESGNMGEDRPVESYFPKLPTPSVEQTAVDSAPATALIVVATEATPEEPVLSLEEPALQADNDSRMEDSSTILDVSPSLPQTGGSSLTGETDAIPSINAVSQAMPTAMSPTPQPDANATELASIQTNDVETVTPLHPATPSSAISTLSPSRSQPVQRLYPSLAVLDSEMSQPVFAALSRQASVSEEDSQRDELEQTQILQSRQPVRFKDIDRIVRSPSPVETPPITMSQIQELVQSSWEQKDAPSGEGQREDSPDDTASSDSNGSSAVKNNLLPRATASSQSPKNALGEKPDLRNHPLFAQRSSASVTSSQDATSPRIATKKLAVNSASGDDSSEGEIVPPKTNGLFKTSVAIPHRPMTRSAMKLSSQPVMSNFPPSSSAATPSKLPTRASMGIPASLPRTNSISAISQRFKGKLAERRSSGQIMTRQQASQQSAKSRPVDTADSDEDSDDDEDSEEEPSILPPERRASYRPRKSGLASFK